MIKHLRSSIVALGLLPAAVHAAIINYSETFDSSDFSAPISETEFTHTPVFTLAIDQFDPVLGTLDSVTFAYEFTFQFEGVTGVNGGGLSLGGGGEFKLSNTDGVFYSDGGGNSGGGAPDLPISFDIVIANEDGAMGNLENLSYVSEYLIGTDQITLSWSPTIEANVSGTASGTLTLTSGSMSLTYNYTPIPEPSAFAALAGLAALVSVGTRRARRQSV